MKAHLSFLIILSTLLVSGCAMHQLSLNEHGEHFAPTLGVEASELKFLSYCTFRRVQKYQPSRRGSTHGVLAMSDSHFYLMSDEVRRTNYKIEIPINEMEGFAKLPSQFQLKHEGTVMEIRLSRTFSKQDTIAKYDRVYQLLSENEVSEIAAITEYRISGRSSRRNVSSSNANGRYGGISRIGNGGTNNRNVYGTPYTPIENRN